MLFEIVLSAARAYLFIAIILSADFNLKAVLSALLYHIVCALVNLKSPQARAGRA